MELKSFCTKAQDAADFLKSLSNAHRLMVLCRLHEGECSAGALEDIVRINQSALSQHLARLRKDGLVVTRREAQTIYYSLADQRVAVIIKDLYALYCNPRQANNQRKRRDK